MLLFYFCLVFKNFILHCKWSHCERLLNARLTVPKGYTGNLYMEMCLLRSLGFLILAVAIAKLIFNVHGAGEICLLLTALISSWGHLHIPPSESSKLELRLYYCFL